MLPPTPHTPPLNSFPMPNNGNSDSREVSAHVGEGSSSTTHRRLQAPSTPGRPIFGFNSVPNLSRKSFPSKWDDAEKWVVSSHPDSANFPGSVSLDHHDTAHASNGISCSTHAVLKGAISILTSQLCSCSPCLCYFQPTFMFIIINLSLFSFLFTTSKLQLIRILQ